MVLRMLSHRAPTIRACHCIFCQSRYFPKGMKRPAGQRAASGRGRPQPAINRIVTPSPQTAPSNGYLNYRSTAGSQASVSYKIREPHRIQFA